MRFSHFWRWMRLAMKTPLRPETGALVTPDIPGREGRGARNQRPRRNLFLLLPLGLAAVLSFYAIAAQSLWLDEAGSVAVARLDWPGMWGMMADREANMGLYYVLLHYWLQLGTGEFAVRSLSAIIAVAALVPLYGVGVRLFGANVGLIASLLLAVNAFFIQFAQEARSYTLVVLLVTSSSYLFLRALENPSRKNWAGYVVVGALSAYAHFFAAWVIAAHFVSAMVFRSGLTRRRDLIVSNAVIAFLVSPLLVPILTASRLGWLKKPSLEALASLFQELTGYGGSVLVIVYLGVWCSALLSAAAQPRRAQGRWIPWNLVFLFTWLLLPVLGSFLFSLLVKPIFLPRYLIIALPPLVLIAAAGVQNLRPAWLKLTTLLLLLALSGRGLWALYTGVGQFRKENWRAATKYVLDNAEVSDGVVFLASYARKPFEYYVQALRAQSTAPHPVFPSAPWGELELPGRKNSATPREWLSGNRQDHPRLWLVLSHEQYELGSGEPSSWLQENFERQFCVRQEHAFPGGIRVRLYQVCPGAQDPP